MTPGRWRKKPVVVEAVRVTAGLAAMEPVAEWCGGGVVWGPTAEPVGIAITTREGVMRADVGDWVIRGVAGEFYPCKPNIFAATYEPELWDEAETP